MTSTIAYYHLNPIASPVLNLRSSRMPAITFDNGIGLEAPALLDIGGRRWEHGCICAASGSAAPPSRRVSLDGAPGGRRGCWSDAGCAGPRPPRTGSPRPSPSAAAPRTGSPRAGSLRLPPFQRGPSQTYRNWTSRISSSWVKVFANPTFPKNHDDRLLQATSFRPLPGTPSLRTPGRLFSSPPDKPARQSLRQNLSWPEKPIS